MTPVDVRIGVTYSAREIDLQLPDDTDLDALKADISTVIGDKAGVLWLTDRRGRVVGVPAAKVAYVELGSDTGGRAVGFSA
jgi:hypothetical protein